MIKYIYKSKPIIIAFSVIIFSSCTEIIDIDLNSSDPQVVIVGKVATNGVPSEITLTESINFDEENEFPPVQNAIIELSDSQGNSEVLAETSEGVYTTNTLTGVIGETYTLSVQVDDKTYTANCKIPNQVAFSDLNVEESDGNAGGPGGMGSITNYEVKVSYSDPVGEDNYYRFVELINDQVEAAYIFDDRLSDGLTIETALVRFNRDLDTGDNIKIIMQCIDSEVYDYFNSFGNLMGGPGTSTPANPYTNIENGVLGYFSAHTYEVKEFIIP